MARAARALIALIDPLPFRRDSTLAMIRGTFRRPAAGYDGTADFIAEAASRPGRWSCVVLNIGTASVKQLALEQDLCRLIEGAADVPVLLLSDLDDLDEALEALRRGVRGFIPASFEPRVAMAVLDLVQAGGTFFPPDALARTDWGGREVLADQEDRAEPGEDWSLRQLDVLRLLIEGHSNKVIARALDLRESTIKHHVWHITRKLGAKNRTEAALRARKFRVLQGGCPTRGGGAGAAFDDEPMRRTDPSIVEQLPSSG